MCISSIMAIVDGELGSAVAMQTALRIGKTFDAHTALVHVLPPLAVCIPLCCDVEGQENVDLLQNKSITLQERQRERFELLYQDTVVKEGIPSIEDTDQPKMLQFSATKLMVTGHENQEVATRGRLFDIIVMPPASELPGGAKNATLEAALMDIRELNNPLPRWWLWILYACIAWSLGYYVAYPAIPLVSSYTKGVLGYSSRAEVAKDVAAAKEAQKESLDKLDAASLEEIRTDPELLEFALAGGKSAYNVNCSQCHGSGAQGFVGYPNLNDDEWIWGGSLDAIYTTITHGIRNNQSDDARISDMPAFLKDEILEKEQVNQVVEYVLSLSGASTDAAAATAGTEIFAENCAACHGEAGEGIADLGAPALNNAIWLYGGSKETLVETISYSRAGVMPAWGQILDDATVKKLTVYVHSLGGGQ